MEYIYIVEEPETADFLASEELMEALIKGKYDEEYLLRWELSREIITHSMGHPKLICRLLEKKFPSEPAAITEYRLNNFARVTKTYFNKVVSTLAKINRSDDFVIKHKNIDIRDYCESEFPEYGSIRNWFFTVGLKNMLNEPNGYIFIKPEIEPESEALEVDLEMIPACDVLYADSDFVICRHTEDHLYYFDKNSIKAIIIIKEGNGKVRYELEDVLVHNLGTIPLVVFGGLPYSLDHEHTYESFVSGVVPFWDQALIEFSDKQAGIKQHIYPEKWRYKTSSSCGACNGSGFWMDAKGGRMNCMDCNGTGEHEPTGMFSEMLIEKQSQLDSDIPIPPMGYISKDFTAIEYIDKDYLANIHHGLASINMEFLMDSPLNQSGTAKEMDRQELNSFLYQISAHIVNNILVPIYKLVIMWRKYDIKNNVPYGDVTSLMPSITVPQTFDAITGYNYETKIQAAKAANVSAYIINAIEKKFIERTFVNFDDDKNLLLSINTLDPLPGKTVEEKMNLFEKGGITEEDYILSCNIERLVRECIDEYSGWYNYGLSKKMEILYQKTQKLINSISNVNQSNQTGADPTSGSFQFRNDAEPIYTGVAMGKNEQRVQQTNLFDAS